MWWQESCWPSKQRVFVTVKWNSKIHQFCKINEDNRLIKLSFFLSVFILLLLRNNYVDLVLSRTLKEIFTDIVPLCMRSYTLCYYFLNSMLFFSLSVKSLGCFKDTGRRAIPQMDGRNPLVKGFYRKRADAIVRCGLVAMRFGYRVFAVQHQGWCATGPRAHLTYQKYGPSNRCRNGKGGPWANDVYAVYGRFKSGCSSKIEVKLSFCEF